MRKTTNKKSAYNTLNPVASKCVRCSMVQKKKKKKREATKNLLFFFLSRLSCSVNNEPSSYVFSSSFFPPLYYLLRERVSDQCIARLSMTRNMWHSCIYNITDTFVHVYKHIRNNNSLIIDEHLLYNV